MKGRDRSGGWTAVLPSEVAAVQAIEDDDKLSHSDRKPDRPPRNRPRSGFQVFSNTEALVEASPTIFEI